MQETTKVVTGVVRLSYVHLFEPQSFNGQDAKYSATILIPKSDKETIQKIKNAQKVAIEAGKAKFNGKIPTNLATTLHDGDEEKDTNEEPEYAGHYYMAVRSATRPGIVDRFNQEITEDDANKVYSGVYARVSLSFFAYNTAGNKGISAGLNNVQIIKDGDYLGGRSRAEDDFEVFELDDEDDDFLA